ncbi:MAG: glycosyl hydrolase family 65 protein, partial [Armatimonadota bacterium]
TKHERRYLDPEYFDDATPSPSVANLPDPLFVRAFVEGEEISFTRGEVIGFRQEYDLRSGIYSYAYDYRDSHGRTTRIRMERFCDMTNVHRAAMRYSLTPLNYSGRIVYRTGIDGSVVSNLQRDKQFQVVGREVRGNTCLLEARTIARGIGVTAATANVFNCPVDAQGIIEDERVYIEASAEGRSGQEIVLDKYIVLASTEDARHQVVCDVCRELSEMTPAGVDRIRADQADWWRRTWDLVDVRIEGDDLAQLYLRFCIFHLMSAAPRHTDKLSVPCKLLTGEYYQGNTFYDTNLYIVPFYVFTYPEIARHCLNYRWEGLVPAREIAKSLGYEGAKFAWQAGPYGEECLGKWWRFTHTNIHIDGDVAFSLMQYLHATGDEQFMVEKGIDILVESARFYTSRARRSNDGSYHFDAVAGPDEGHCESTDNFYTNLLARKTLEWAADTLDALSREKPDDYDRVTRRLAVLPDEPESWRAVARGLTFLFNPDTKLYEQCEGFYQLQPIPPDLLENRRTWFVTVFPYQALNQPDVVMGMAMLPEEFPEDVRRANWQFYKDKSMNFSSMSFVINSLMAKDMGEMDYAYEQFLISAGEDLDEELTGRRDTAEGLHGTASGGAWMAAVFGFGGFRFSERGLSINPRLPDHWKSLEFNCVVRGELLSVRVDCSRVAIRVGNRKGIEIDAVVVGKETILRSGQVYEAALGE